MKTGCKEVSRDVYEVQFADIFDRVIACAAGMPINAVNGRFPARLRSEVSYVIGTLNASKHPEASGAFLNFLRSPECQNAYANFGLSRRVTTNYSSSRFIEAAWRKRSLMRV